MTTQFKGFIRKVEDKMSALEVTVALSEPESSGFDLRFNVPNVLRQEWTPGRMLHFTVYALPKDRP